MKGSSGSRVLQQKRRLARAGFICPAPLPHSIASCLPADANQQSACEQQLTPAHLAARWGHAAVLQVLQRHGGDLRRRSGARGWTPLDEAREWRRQACIDMLQGLEAEGNA